MDDLRSIFARFLSVLKKRYPEKDNCKCRKEIVIYEGEYGEESVGTQRALDNWPIKTEEEYEEDIWKAY